MRQSRAVKVKRHSDWRWRPGRGSVDDQDRHRGRRTQPWRRLKRWCAPAARLCGSRVPDNDAAIALKEIRKRVPDVPLVADIHFHYKLALCWRSKRASTNCDSIRETSGSTNESSRCVRAAQAQKVPIRIGVNGGSLEKDLLKKYGTATPEAMVESAMRHIQILEDLGFTDTIISLKASDVHRTVAAYRLLAEKVDYPFHLGVTEAGTAFGGTIKSSIGLGILLHEGIGDTIRVLARGGTAGRSARRLGDCEIAWACARVV